MATSKELQLARDAVAVETGKKIDEVLKRLESIEKALNEKKSK